MRNILLLALALFTFQANAQERKEEMKRSKMEMVRDMTPEEVATLQTKRLTLDLDLNKSQQDKIYKIHLKQAQERKEKMEQRATSKDKNKEAKPDRYEMMNKRLDAQIELKKQFKSILTSEQYEKWESSLDKRRGKKGKKRGMRKPDMEDKK